MPDRSDLTLPCLACGKPLTSALPGACINQPSGATTFTTTGHYGSTVFDPMDGSRLDVNVCDDCLTARRDRVLHIAHDGTLQPWGVD
ncbi:hypothetical protein FH608_046210 [Nonomuraea phyllanthi]|uniref:Uncharacterized protein n=1 Tax=Nonomuraea phyllanthi TaxID=2219224 RepID=A0A5C4V5W8_9ACTN|nr:hypothetical protein [Nonomuraea phyllanthi]KAB8186889.1 hypothetical protein FH608_046210 [Nonomuraea phyllanthi]